MNRVTSVWPGLSVPQLQTLVPPVLGLCGEMKMKSPISEEKS